MRRHSTCLEERRGGEKDEETLLSARLQRSGVAPNNSPRVPASRPTTLLVASCGRHRTAPHIVASFNQNVRLHTPLLLERSPLLIESPLACASSLLATCYLLLVSAHLQSPQGKSLEIRARALHVVSVPPPSPAKATRIVRAVFSSTVDCRTTHLYEGIFGPARKKLTNKIKQAPSSLQA